MKYRRANIPGGTYFFTVNLADQDRTLLTDHADTLRQVMREVQRNHPFQVDGIVILPEHLHALWTLPSGDSDYPTSWMLIKAGFSRRMTPEKTRSSSRTRKGERGVWQRRYWEHVIRDDGDYRRHMDYIHYNPVKHGYTARASDWPHSSIHRYIARGVIDPAWGIGAAEDEGGFGER
jgi:putative transposase